MGLSKEAIKALRDKDQHWTEVCRLMEKSHMDQVTGLQDLVTSAHQANERLQAQLVEQAQLIDSLKKKVEEYEKRTYFLRTGKDGHDTSRD